jgi:hypothetical protein
MTSSVIFRIKESVDIEKHKIIELFFKDWVDGTCDNQVKYKTGYVPKWQHLNLQGTLRVEFEMQEDATALRLRGVPHYFRDYLEIIT